MISGSVIPATNCPSEPNYGSQRSGPSSGVTDSVGAASIPSSVPEVEAEDPTPELASSSSAAAAPAEPAQGAVVLSQPTAHLSGEVDPRQVLRPSGFKTATSPAVHQNPTEVRIAIDFHNVLDVERAEGRADDKIQRQAGEAIGRFLLRSDKHLVSIVSYIGERGRKSQQRRQSLREEVQKLNSWLLASGVGRPRLVRLLITADPFKSVLERESVSLHCDDKLSILDTCYRNGVIPIWFSRRPNQWYQSFDNLEDTLARAEGLVQPRVYEKPILGEIVH